MMTIRERKMVQFSSVDYFLFKTLLIVAYISSLNLKTRGFSEIFENPIAIYNLNRVVGTILIPLLSLLLFTKHKKLSIRIPKAFVGLILYFFFSIIGTILTNEPIGYPLFKIAEIFSLIVLGITVYSFISVEKEYAKLSEKYNINFLKFIHIMVLINILIFRKSFTLFARNFYPAERLSAAIPAISANGLGFISSFLLLYEISKKGGKLKHFWLLISILFILWSFARAALIAFLISISIYVLINQKTLFKKTFALLFLVAIAFFSKNPLIEYLKRGESEYSLKTLSGRLEYWPNAIQYFSRLSIKDKILGNGFAIGLRKFVTTYSGEGGTSLDNDLLNALFSGGILGAIMILMIYLRMVKLTFNIYKDAPYSIGFTISMVIRGLTIANFSIFNLLAPFMIIWIALFERANEYINKSNRKE